MFLRVLGNVALFLIIVFLIKKRVTMFLTMKEAWSLVEVEKGFMIKVCVVRLGCTAGRDELF